MTYQVKAPGTNHTVEFSTPDNAYDYARRNSTYGMLLIRSGVGLSSSLKAVAWCGRLYSAVPCKDCRGTGRNGFGSLCHECHGEGATRGVETP